MRDGSADSDGDEEDAAGYQTPDVEGAAAGFHHEAPGEDCAAETEGGLSDGEIVGGIDIEASALVELGGVAHKGCAAEGLCQPAHGRYFGPTKISSTEAVPVVASCGLLHFKLVCGFHHGDLLVDIESYACIAGCERQHGLFCFIETTMSDQPPWRFRTKVGTNHDWNWPNPLNRKGDTIAPLGVKAKHASQYTRRDQLPDDPA